MLPCAATWVHLEDTTWAKSVSRKSQAPCDSTHLWDVKRKLTDTDSVVETGGGGGGRNGQPRGDGGWSDWVAAQTATLDDASQNCTPETHVI